MLLLYCDTQIHTQCSKGGQRAGQPQSHLAGSAGPDAPQSMVSHFGFQGTLQAHIQFAFRQNLQIPFHRAAAALLPLIPHS